LANLYDKKQLPLKILANSWFGSYGAPYIFNWVTQIQLKTTCRGRQYLRLMVRHFTENMVLGRWLVIPMVLTFVSR
jgi:DNA polymerase elongation subunit (family B)